MSWQLMNLGRGRRAAGDFLSAVSHVVLSSFFCFEGLLHVCGHEGPYHDQRMGVLVLIGNLDSSRVCQDVSISESGREP
jgi:hypothetical protein